MNQLSDKEIRLMCLCKAIEVLVPNRFRFTATKDVPGPFLDTAKQFYDFVNAGEEAVPKATHLRSEPGFRFDFLMDDPVDFYAKIFGVKRKPYKN